MVYDTTYDKADFTENPLPRGEYENCEFVGCNFSGTNLSGVKFIDCRFIGSNLSLARMDGALLRDVTFRDCKMLGLRFDACNPFGMAFSFDNCVLDHSSFYGTKIKKTVFRNCHLHEVEFTEADLTEASLDNCDLKNARFERTLLEKADLRSAFNYTIDPDLNRIKKARFSYPGVLGLLVKYDIRIE